MHHPHVIPVIQTAGDECEEWREEASSESNRELKRRRRKDKKAQKKRLVWMKRQRLVLLMALASALTGESHDLLHHEGGVPAVTTDFQTPSDQSVP